MRRALLFLLFVSICLPATATTSQPASSEIQRKLVGHWKLLTYVTFPASGGQRPGQYDNGLITYDDHGNMSAHLMRSGRKPLSSPPTDAERAAAYSGYLGYWGRYEIDTARGSVTHVVAGSSNPNWLTSRQVRYYEFSPDGKRLMLSIKDGDRVAGTLTWERLDAKQ